MGKFSWKMRYLGIDYGERRTGLSIGDDELGVATPLEPICHPGVLWARLEEMVRQRHIEAFVLGWPVGMNGQITARTKRVEAIGAMLEKRFHLPVHYGDERLTSFQVDVDLAAAGMREKWSRLRQQRQTGRDDSRAATLILQDFLEEQKIQRITGED